MDCSLLGSSVHGINSPGKNTGMGSYFLLWGIFPGMELLHYAGLLHNAGGIFTI